MYEKKTISDAKHHQKCNCWQVACVSNSVLVNTINCLLSYSLRYLGLLSLKNEKFLMHMNENDKMSFN